jgi:hypothetical protein
MSNLSQNLPLNGADLTAKDGDNMELTPTDTVAKKAAHEHFSKPCSKSKKIKYQLR